MSSLRNNHIIKWIVLMLECITSWSTCCMYNIAALFWPSQHETGFIVWSRHYAIACSWVKYKCICLRHDGSYILLFSIRYSLKLHKVLILWQDFSKTSKPILMKLCMWLRHIPRKVLVPLACLGSLYSSLKVTGRRRQPQNASYMKRITIKP